ncbi:MULTISPECIES: helix-turn-helix domain-containing protein [unclassified Methylobacterium]|uniref:helix-turn-helix domain-containing protein n=1 Tax=unclassified Methylobacterium TaxID=2615210 RepID=UPI00226ACA28|nr:MULTISPECIES: helix-turn-helix domain-containing protein [unclassified Methylobacterium]
MEVRPHPSFADPGLTDLIERAQAAQSVAQTAQSAVWAYITECQQGAGAGVEPDHWPLSANHPDLLTVAQAAARAGRHVDTITRWCRERGVGKKYGGRWRVSIRRLNTILH